MLRDWYATLQSKEALVFEKRPFLCLPPHAPPHPRSLTSVSSLHLVTRLNRKDDFIELEIDKVMREAETKSSLCGPSHSSLSSSRAQWHLESRSCTSIFAVFDSFGGLGLAPIVTGGAEI